MGNAWEITPAVIEEAESLASLGITREQIYLCLGIGHTTFYKYMKESSNFADAVKKGEAKAVAFVASELLKNIKAKNVTAQIFFLKCHGWNDGSKLEVKEKENENKYKIEKRRAKGRP
jgi:predicted DNA-binding transcriptional regulator AlpA